MSYKNNSIILQPGEELISFLQPLTNREWHEHVDLSLLPELVSTKYGNIVFRNGKLLNKWLKLGSIKLGLFFQFKNNHHYKYR